MAKTDFLTADMTRRQFMKISGKSLAGLTLSASMLSLFGCSQKQVDAGAVATWALPQGLLVVNADLCTGCQRCEINCTLTNDGVCSSYISRVKIQRRLNLDGAGNGLLSGGCDCRLGTGCDCDRHSTEIELYTSSHSDDNEKAVRCIVAELPPSLAAEFGPCVSLTIHQGISFIVSDPLPLEGVVAVVGRRAPPFRA